MIFLLLRYFSLIDAVNFYKEKKNMLLSIAIIAIAGVAVLFGFLLGLKRGFDKSLIRIILVAVALVAAWLLREQITNWIMNITVSSGKTVAQTITEAIPADYANFADMILPIVKMITCVAVFIASFIILQFATWLIGLIVGVFFRRTNARFLGGVIGLVQGALVAFAIIIPLNGAILSTEKLTSLEINGEQPLNVQEYVDFTEYKESQVCKFVSKIGDGIYAQLASVKVESGERKNLDDQIDAFVAGVKIAEQAQKFNEIDTSNGLDENSVAQIKQILADIDEIKGQLTPAQKSALNEMVAAASDALGLTDSIADIDITEVDFTSEGAILDKALAYQNGEILDAEAAQELVNSLAESKFILPLADGNMTVDVPLVKQGEILNAVNNLGDDVSEETKTAIKKLFNINI